jgi:6-phospho-3-hexuloisomerase
MAERASRKGIKIFLITATAESRISKLSFKSVILNTPSKNNKVGSFSSIQPMTTLFEQCLGIYCDSLVLKIMSEANENSDSMWKRHSILE